MPLSEHEQRMLDEIESQLYADDPRFASSVRRTAAFGGRRPSAAVVVLTVLGIVLLVGGLFLPKPGDVPVVSIVGFLLVFGAGVMALRSRPKAQPGAPGSAGPAPASGRGGSSFTSRMEDRFRGRFDR